MIPSAHLGEAELTVCREGANPVPAGLQEDAEERGHFYGDFQGCFGSERYTSVVGDDDDVGNGINCADFLLQTALLVSVYRTVVAPYPLPLASCPRLMAALGRIDQMKVPQ